MNDYIFCDSAFYDLFRQSLGRTIWEREFARARRRLARLKASR